MGTKYAHEVAALPYNVELVQVFDTSQGLTCVVISESPRHVKPQDVVQVISCALKNEDNLRNSFPFLHIVNNAGDVGGWGKVRHVEVVFEPVLNAQAVGEHRAPTLSQARGTTWDDAKSLPELSYHPDLVDVEAVV